MVQIKKCLSTVLVLYAGIHAVVSLDVDCNVLVGSTDAFCNMLVNNSACWDGTCKCVDGFRETGNGECIEDKDDVSSSSEYGIVDSFEWINKKVETETIVRDEVKSSVYEMELPNLKEVTDADDYLERYRRQDTGLEGCGEEPETASLLLDYGSAQEDTSVARSNDGCTKLEFAFKLPFLKTLGFNAVYVCVNGLVSFGSPLESPDPPPNNVNRPYLSGRYVACPYFADIDITTAGNIWYHAYSAAAGDLSNDSTEKKVVEEYVHSIYNPAFESIFLLKVTWAACRRNGGQADETVTMQMTYVSDLNNAYMFYTYVDGEMKFKNGRQFIGVVANGLPNGLVDSADFTTLKRPDQFLNLKKRNGLVAYSVGSVTPFDSESVCIRWVQGELANLANYESAVRNRLPICPCNRFVARLMNNFIFVSEEDGTITYAAAPSASYAPYGQTCTYRRNGFIRSRPRRAGRFQRYNQISHPDLHQQDLIYKDICCTQSNLCRLYYAVRPRIRSCFFIPIFVIGFGRGDPHFATLDGLDYTFNGLGEYLLTKHNVANPKLEIQTRTARLATTDGLSEATVFSAFVVKGLENFVQVEIKTGGMSVAVKIGANNWIDLTSDFESNTLSFTESDLNLKREDKELVAFFNAIGVRFTVSESNGLLQYSISFAGDDFKGQMIGLLGNFNGDKSDDLIPKGSTTSIPDTSNDKEIFQQFGKTWITTAEESIFKYAEGKSHDQFSFPDFVPKFLADIDPAKLEEAKIQCGGENEIECIFDYSITNDLNVAQDTKVAVGKADEDKALAANEIPNVAPSSGAIEKDELYYIHTMINENKKIVVVGQDDGTVTAELIDSTATATLAASATAGTYEINLSVQNENPVSLSVVVKDDKGAESPALEFIIVLCTGCNSRGVCDYDNIREDARETDTFKYATCTCEEYYDGADCENDFDGCFAKPCSDRGCTDTVAAEHKANPSLNAFTCGPCPTGYEADGAKCKDIDECTDTAICGQQCINIDGSYKCECNNGYRLDPNKKDCNDINECEESTSGCEQICENTAGGVTCSCQTGFTLNADTKTCAKDAALPTGCDAIDCSKAEGCTLDKDNNAICFCKAGFSLQGDNTCANIDECTASPCDQTCKDNEGGFECSCHVGYKLQDDKVSCKACEPPFFGADCASKCECDVGATSCDPVRGCVCGAGWTGTNCETDVNECDTPGTCTDTDKECVNIVGSYKCSCLAGYKADENGQCVDINECNDINLNTCEKVCTNTPGGFSCSCPSGYNVDPTDSKKCIDIDECTDGVSGCEHICVNNIGRYSCLCKSGYTINDDRKTCTLSEDPCAAFTDISCSQICEFVNDAPKCSCRIGFLLGDDDQTCIDINECDPNKNLNKCTEKDKCVNVNGGFTCSCSPGFKLENDKFTCTACDSEHYGVNCANECACGAGAEKCDPVTGCVCKEGWSGDKCDVDRNECVDSPCTGANTECVNIPGSYQCPCKSGYKENANKICEDIDECASTSSICEQKCDNTVGSYTCSCFAGFVEKDGKCEDIDECQGQHDCSQVCTNTLGSYRCSCNDGYNLDLTDRATCTAAETCVTNPCGLNTDCAVISGTATCTCKAGFKFVTGSTTVCEDILECNFDPSPCSQSCAETSGGYTCSCNLNGYKLDTDESTCIECTDNTYGNDCTQNCNCVVANTESCSNVDGACTCKEGWNGATCADNIDECPTVTCPENSECVDTEGSYYCKCAAGYLLTSENVCQVCNEGTYGENCAQTCSCIASKTETCNAVDGSCTCNGGWEGTICNQNINECTRNTFDCPADSTCQDTQGSYVCNCNIGFIKTADNLCKVCEQGSYGQNCENVCACVPSNTASCNSVDGTCTCKAGWEGTTCNLNINECTRNTFTCPALSTCEDNDGSYVCNCNAGYQKDSNQQCIDINECTANTDNCNQKCTNTIGSFTCSCDIGYSGTGNDCTQCSASWGEQCANPCNCNGDNTVRCDHVTGCVCKAGWQGVTCADDVNECDTNPCGANELCTNNVGSYTCACKTGYIKDQDVCNACTNNKYGDNCGTSCNCVNANTLVPTQSCDHITGSCRCNAFWEGSRCQTDINECTNNTDNCTKDNEGCHNTVEGFECSCVLGYVRDTNGNCVTDTSPGVTTAALPAATVSINIVLTLEHTLTGNLQVTLTNAQYKEEFKTKMTAYLKRVLGDVTFTVIVNSITSGSLVADYNVVLPKTSLPDLGKANGDLASHKENITFFDQTSPVTRAVVENTSIPTGQNAASDDLTCKAYEASINNCNTDYTCMVKNGKPVCEPDEEDNFPLIFGLGFGIPMFLLCALAIFVLVWFIRSRNRKRAKSREIPDDRSSSLFGHRLPVRVITGVPGPFSVSPETRAYEPSEHSSETSDFDYRFDRFENEPTRPGQSTWNYLFHTSRGDDKYHIRRPKVEQEAWGRYTYDNYY